MPRLNGVWKLAGGVAGLLLCFVLLVESIAYATWWLAGAGSQPEEHVAPRQPDESTSAPNIGHHRVYDWPGDSNAAFEQAPALKQRVEQGALPPLEERLPEKPLVIEPPQQQGPYGGEWNLYTSASGAVRVHYRRLTYEGLVRWCPMGERVLPNLARDWEMKNGGRTYIIHLRPGVRWSDGERFDAGDIMFWYEHVLQNEDITSSINREWMHGGELVELTKLDDHTLRFDFAKPHGLFIERTLASNRNHNMIVPSHYMKQFHADFIEPTQGAELDEDELPQWYRRRMRERGFQNWSQLYNYMDRWQNVEKPTLRAWKLRRGPPARPIIYTRNPYYWKVDPAGRQLPYIDRLSFNVFDMQIITMRAIEGQMEMQKRHIRFDNYPLLMQNRRRGDYQIRHWQAGSGSDLIVAPNINHRDPATRQLMNEPRFRKALSLAIDRQTMNQARYFGQAQPRQVAASQHSPFHDPAYESAYIQYDPQRAVRMLASLGLERRRDGRWLGFDGRPLRFQIDVANTPSGGDVLADLIAEAWTAIGIRTDINRLASALFTQRRTANMHDFIVWEGEWEDNPTVQPRWYIPYFGGSMHAIEYALWFSSNGKAGREPEGDIREAIEVYWQIETETDRQKRIELFHRISELNRENLWVIGTLGRAPVPVIVHNDMKNVPDVALSTWEVRSPGNTATECYALDRDHD